MSLFVNVFTQSDDVDLHAQLESFPILNENKGSVDVAIDDMNMGYETESVSERSFLSNTTTGEKSDDDSEAEHHKSGTTYESAFETYVVSEEVPVSDDIPVVNASKFRKPAYQ